MRSVEIQTANGVRHEIYDEYNRLMRSIEIDEGLGEMIICEYPALFKKKVNVAVIRRRVKKDGVQNAISIDEAIRFLADELGEDYF
jgi:hypothetical protein